MIRRLVKGQREIFIIQPMAQPPRGQPEQGQNNGIVLLQNTFSSDGCIKVRKLWQLSYDKNSLGPFNCIESLPPTMEVQDQSTGTESDILKNWYFTQIQRYDTDLGHTVSNRLKMKIISKKIIIGSPDWKPNTFQWKRVALLWLLNLKPKP